MKKRIALMLLCVCVVLALPFIANFFTMPIIGILKGAAVFERKTSGLIQKASSFDPDITLRRLQDSSINQPYYLFDQQIAAATYDDGSVSGVTKAGQTFSTVFDFEGSDPFSLAFHNADHTIRDGICSIQSRPGAYAESTQDLSLPLADLSEIEIRLKIKQGKEVLLGLSSNSHALWDDREKIVKEVKVGAAKIGGWSVELVETCTIPFAVIPDSMFHIYTIDVEDTLAKARVDFDDRVRKLFVRFPEVPGNEIEIDYIRFITKKEKFSRSRFGTTYIKKNREYRQALYMNTPGSLRYTLTVPASNPYLSFGNSILLPDDPVEFVVSLEEDGHKKILLRETKDNPDSWFFVKLDLNDYAGRTVDIVFDAASNNGNIAFWSNPVLYALPRERFNVIIVLEDALRADHLSMYGYSRNTSPAREKFARDGVVFESAFSQATATRPSCPSFMTSLFPTAAGVGLNHETLRDNYVTLAEIMQSQGYATAAISQNQNAGYYNGLHQGFSSLYALEKPQGDRSAADVYGKLISWLDEIQGRNFFVYLHIMDPHGPYQASPPFDAWYRQMRPDVDILVRDPALDPAWVDKPTQEGRRLLYDGAILQNDHWFERFIDMLSSRGLLENTLIVFMSDHGENLGERGVWGHAPPGYIQGIRVPLIMRYPEKLPAGIRIKTPVQSLDIMPTILDLAGIDKDQLVLQGDSLLSLIDGSRQDFWDSRLCFSEEVINRNSKFDGRPFGSFFFGGWHVLNSKDFLPFQRRSMPSSLDPLFFKAFHVEDDTAEDRPLKIFYTDPLGKMLIGRVVSNFHRANQNLWQAFSGQEEGSVRIDPAVQERLRALGYLQ